MVASLGDASINHSTAVGALNAAGHAVHTRLPLPLLVVVEDNGWGISVPSPPGWVEAALSSRPGFTYLQADGSDPAGALATAREAADRRPRDAASRRSCTCGPCGSSAMPAPTPSSATAASAT